MAGYVVEVKIIDAGRPVGLYRPAEQDSLLTLEAMHIPETSLPVDRAEVPRSLTVENRPLPVLLLGTTSHPPGTRLLARVLGGIRDDQDVRPPVLLAVPDVDPLYARVQNIDDLDAGHREVLRQAFEDLTQKFTWLSRDDVWPYVQEAQRAYRVALNVRVEEEASPLWRPPAPYRGRLAFARLEHYTEAEYTFFRLPRRFQDYIASHLAADERILYALWRPRLRSRRRRSFWRRDVIHEGVLLLTDQRLLHLTELVPPDSAGVRYGFFSHMGVLERLQDARLESAGDDMLLLRARWRTAQGTEESLWEFPRQSASALMELLSLLRAFTPAGAGERALRRASVPPVPRDLPPLVDPAANDPAQVASLQARFRNWVDRHLPAPVQTWALLPAWAHPTGIAHLWVVTPRRLWEVPDPATEDTQARSWSLADVGTLVFQDSILNAFLELHVTDGKVRLGFPHGAIRAFHRLAEQVRRCIVAQAV